MTAVPRLQLLPAPGTSPGGSAVAVAGRGEQRVQPVLPAKATERGRPDFRPSAIDERQAREKLTNQRAADGRGGAARLGSGGRDQASPTAVRGETGGGQQLHFSRLSSLPFMVQVLGQQAGADRPQAVAPQTSLAGHRDAALLGSDIYRRAGGEPEILPEDATFVRLAV